MAATLQKPVVTLGGVALAGVGTIVWRFVTGVAPYATEFQVHKSDWTRLSGRTGVPLQLLIKDSRGIERKVEGVYILYQAPSDSPNRVSFIVSDVRWRWVYKLVARDFNMVRKTGDRTAFQSVPVETQVSVDTYDYLAYSLNKDANGHGVRWSAQDALEEVLKLVAVDAQNKPAYHIESFPIHPSQSEHDEGAFTLQNVSLRDSGDAAIARMLSYIPGAEVYIDDKGKARIFDATDLSATEDYLRDLPPNQWVGDKVATIDRKKVRPQRVRVHYVREIECLFRFKDQFTGTTTGLQAGDAYLENVVPTPDPQTQISEFDPVSNSTRQVTKAVGTYVNFQKWLQAMDAVRPDGSFPWTFDTLKRLWVQGDLDGALGAGALDLDKAANISMRVQAIKDCFRQLFRINRNYMERIRDVRAVRVGLLDPVTGARAPARVWGQYAVIPSDNGAHITARDDRENIGYARNVDALDASKHGAPIAQTTPGVQTVLVEDPEVGILRIECVQSPYGLTGSFVPCLLVNEHDSAVVPVRDLRKQDTLPTGFGFRVEGTATGIFLKSTMELAAMVTIVPAAPNNTRQFHVVEVAASEVADVYRTNYRIQGGQGPSIEVFVNPGEMTARFAWVNDDQAADTLKQLLGLSGDGQGIDGTTLAGFQLMNGDRALSGHAMAVAAEMLAPFADSVQGTAVTIATADPPRLQGNMSGIAVRVSGAPTAKVDVVHSFPGLARAISRYAMMPEATRRIVLGIVPFK
jgi:hypothetical protein